VTRRCNRPNREQQVSELQAVASTPDEQTPMADLREGEFREVLADIPDGTVDLILTSPPCDKDYSIYMERPGRFCCVSPETWVAIGGNC